MQSSTSLPIDFYSVDFPINDMTSLSEAVNAPLWQSGQDPSLSATGIADTSAFSLRSASVDSGLPATSQTTTKYNATPGGALQTTGSQYHGTAGEYVASDIAKPPPNQGISYTFKNWGPDNYRTSTRSGILAANDTGIVPSNEVIQPSIPLTSVSYYQQGYGSGAYGQHGHSSNASAEPSGPSEHYNGNETDTAAAGPSTLINHDYTQDNASVPSHQYRNGAPVALVLLSGVPPFYIPMDVANALQNIYTQY